MGELGNLLDSGGGLAESGENGTNVSSFLHRNNSELVLLVDPCQESLFIIMEDASAIRPVSVETTGFKESITLLEQEVIFNELLLVLGLHSLEWVVLSC